MSLITILLGLLVALVVLWAALLLTLAIVRPRGTRLTETIRTAAGHAAPANATVQGQITSTSRARPDLLLLVYLASPIDLIPDFIPVIGYADDAIVSYIVLRSVVRTAGPDVITQHWPGSPEGLAAVRRLLGHNT